MAQAEAYYGCGQWVDYFLHAGHLSIRGLKMSKSLKNFVTIKEALRDHPARHLRLMFLMAQWDKGIVYSDQTLDDARSKDEKLRNFFSAARSLVSFADGAAVAGGAAAPQSWRPEERRLSGALRGCRARVHAALCDNFDTPTAMAALFEVVGTCNVYMAQCGARARWAAVHEVARYVSRILQVFGVVAGADHLGFPAPESSSSSPSEQGGAAGREEVLAPVMQRVAAFRDGVRALARSKRDACGPEASRALLGLCDAFRDEACVDLGIRLEDRADGGSVVKSLSERPEVLRREIEERRAREREAASKCVSSVTRTHPANPQTRSPDLKPDKT